MNEVKHKTFLRMVGGSLEWIMQHKGSGDDVHISGPCPGH